MNPPDMDNNFLKALELLPAWMIFVIIIIILISPIVVQVLNIVKNKKIESMILKINISQTELIENVNGLIEVMYEKYANYVTLEMGKSFIDAIYTRTAYSIVDFSGRYLLDSENYVDGQLTVGKFEFEFTNFIENRFLKDTMVLNKIRCKNVSLDFFLSEHIKHEFISKDYLEFLEKIKNNEKEIIFNKSKNYILVMYKKFTNRSFSLLELDNF